VLAPYRVRSAPYQAQVVSFREPAELWRTGLNPALDAADERTGLVRSHERERVLRSWDPSGTGVMLPPFAKAQQDRAAPGPVPPQCPATFGPWLLDSPRIVINGRPLRNVGPLLAGHAVR
jgi:hypothetical protein